MAGEWLKFEANTPEKSEVFSITVAMGWTDPDLTVGKLLKVWRWFDQQTIDGNAPNVTLALLDHISGVSGFAQAMCNVHWLVLDGDGLHLPNFERHNGQTAKDRCLTAKRVAKHKTNGKGNADGVTSPLPREEKRREEEEKKEPKSKAESSRASRLPADWHPTDAEVEFCKTERPDLRPSIVATRFFDYWIAQPGVKGRKVDWPATWRNWVRNEKLQPGPRASAGAPMDLAAAQRAANDEAKRRLGIPLTGNSERIIDARE